MIKIAEITEQERENVRKAISRAALSRAATVDAENRERHGGPGDRRLQLHKEINARKVVINQALFIKSPEQRKELKRAKLNYKANPTKGRDEILKAFVDSKIPNWNFKFILS